VVPDTPKDTLITMEVAAVLLMRMSKVAVDIEPTQVEDMAELVGMLMATKESIVLEA